MRPDPTGTKSRDYWWTVITSDPIAIPLTRLLLARKWLSPDQVSVASALLGVAVAPVFALGSRQALIAGALIYHLSFILDCVDGKLARAMNATSVRGDALDRLADAARRLGGAAGIIMWLWPSDARPTDVWWGIAFALLYGFYVEVAGVEKMPDTTLARRWSGALARRRLLPHPGPPDLEALVFVVGPLTGWVVPALMAGSAIAALASTISVGRMIGARGLGDDEARARFRRSWWKGDGGGDPPPPP